MIIRMVELLLEYMSLILCIHKIAKKKITFCMWLIVPFLLEGIWVLWSNGDTMPVGYKLFIFGGLFIYTKIKVTDTWHKAINVFGTMLIVIMFLQLLQYYLFKLVTQEFYITRYGEIIANINICLLIMLWRGEYGRIIVAKLNKIRGVIITVIFSLIFIRMLYLFSQNDYIDFEIAVQFLVETIGLSIACILWISAEGEKNHKERELQMYELYNRAFEEAIVTIRTRQHEFENHINAIKCMQYTIEDHEKLIAAQEQYCEKVLQENKLNKLLKMDLEPVLIGFLYSKIKAAEEKGISTKYELQPVDIKKKIAIYEFIELVGILYDNAVEALEENDNKVILLKLQMEDETSFSLEVANTSIVYPNSEIEKFCSYGYSTKGEKRGVGLARTKEIVQKHNAVYLIHNCIYNGENYLCFKIKF